MAGRQHLVRVRSSFAGNARISFLHEQCADHERGSIAEHDRHDYGRLPSVEALLPVSQTVHLGYRVHHNEGTVQSNRWTRWINEKSPVDVTFVPVAKTESAAKFNALLAAGEAPDYIQDYSASYKNELYLQKQIMPLDDLIAQHSKEYKQLLEKFPALAKLGRKPDGKIYTVGRVLGSRPNHVLFIRTDWLKNLGLEIPKTDEELYRVAKAFAEMDPDGNGKKDTLGININGKSSIDYMFQSEHWVVMNDSLVRGWEQMKEAAGFKKRLFEEGIVDRDYLADKTGAKAQQDWVNGKLGIFSVSLGVNLPNGLKIYETFKKNNPDGEIIPIELPRTKFGQFNPMITIPFQMTGVVNVKAEDPVSVMKYIDFMSSEEVMLTLKYGIDGEHNQPGKNGCRQFIRTSNCRSIIRKITRCSLLGRWRATVIHSSHSSIRTNRWKKILSDLSMRPRKRIFRRTVRIRDIPIRKLSRFKLPTFS